MKSKKHKRLTVSVSPNIDSIKQQLKNDLGLNLTYVQVFDYLVDFYCKRQQKPMTVWANVPKKEQV